MPTGRGSGVSKAYTAIKASEGTLKRQDTAKNTVRKPAQNVLKTTRRGGK